MMQGMFRVGAWCSALSCSVIDGQLYVRTTFSADTGHFVQCAGSGNGILSRNVRLVAFSAEDMQTTSSREKCKYAELSSPW
jgi:hypothetical protein